MAYKIIWSEEAIKTFEANLNYLEEFWNENVIRNFVNETNTTLNLISKTPFLIKASENSSLIRKALIVKQISLYYRINDVQKQLN